MSDFPAEGASEELDARASEERDAGGTDNAEAEGGPVPLHVADRFCLICNMSSTGPPGSEFLQPCRCGYWVHDQCLINVAMHFEDMNPDSRAIGCRICRRTYNISPVKDCVLKYGLKTFAWYQFICQIGLELFLVLVADFTFIIVGSSVFKMAVGVSQACGREEAKRIFSSMDPSRAVLACQWLPVACIVVNQIPWEHTFLRLLRKCSRLPVVGGAFPMEHSEVPDIYERSSHFSLELVGGLILPFFAVPVSKLFPTSIDPFYRLLLGGVAFVVLKGICKMYYKQKKYSRFCTLSVASQNVANV